MASLVITLKSSEAAELKGESGAPHESLQAIQNHLTALASGNAKGKVYAQSASADPVAASGTWTLASVIATDTASVGGVTFTFTSSPVAETDVEVDGADNTADAAALAAAVNAHSTISKIVTATSSGAVVTVTAKQRGVVGNFIQFTDGDSTITSSGSGYLAGGTGGASDAEAAFNFGE
jgi:phage tail sheath gpL-like